MNTHFTQNELKASLESLGITTDAQAQPVIQSMIKKGVIIEGYNDGSKGSINETSQGNQFISNVKQDISKRISNIGQGIKEIPQAYNQEANNGINDSKTAGVVGAGLKTLQQPLNVASNVIGAGFDVLSEGAKAALTPEVKQDIKTGISKVASSKLGQKVISDVAGDWEKFKSTKLGQAILQNPDLTRALENTVNVLSVIPAEKTVEAGVNIAKPVIKEGISTAKKLTSDVGKTLSEIKPNINIPKIGVKSPSEKALDAITPKISSLSDIEYQKLLSQDKILPRNGIKAKPQYILSEEEKQLAEKYSSLLQSNDPAKNVISVADKIKNTDKEVGDFLTKNNGIFNTGELKNKLKSSLENVDDLTIPEDRLTKMKNKVIDSFIKGLDKNDMYTLWQKRKEFDRQIENAFKGSYSVTKDVKKEFRNAIQQFIKDKTPNNIYADKMKEMSDLIGINDVLGQKAASEKSMNAIRAWIERNPEAAKAIGWTVGSTGVIGLGASILK